MTQVGNLFVHAILAILRVLLVAAVGVTLNRMGFLFGHQTRIFSKVVFNGMLPGLIFVKIAGSITVERLVQWWPLAIGPLLCMAVGYAQCEIVVRLMNRLCHPGDQHSVIDNQILLGNNGGSRSPPPLSPQDSPESSNSDHRTKDEDETGASSSSDNEEGWDSMATNRDTRDTELLLAESGREAPDPYQMAFIPAPLKSAMQASMAFNNAFSFPLLVILALIDTVPSLQQIERAEAASGAMAADDDARSIATAYVTFFSCITSAQMWLVGYSVMKRAGLKASARWQALLQNSSEDKADSLSGHLSRGTNRWWHRMTKTSVFQRLVTPPNCAILLGLVVGCTVPLKNAFVGPDAPLLFVAGACETVGAGVVPISLVVLGAKLSSFRPTKEEQRALAAQQKNDSHVSMFEERKVTFVQLIPVLLVKLVMTPALMLCFVLALSSVGALPAGDRLFPLVMVVEAASPTAANMVVVADLAGHSQRAVSLFQFGGYCISALTVALWATLVLSLFP